MNEGIKIADMPIRDLTDEEKQEYEAFISKLMEKRKNAELAESGFCKMIKNGHITWGGEARLYRCTACNKIVDIGAEREECGYSYCPHCGRKVKYE